MAAATPVIPSGARNLALAFVSGLFLTRAGSAEAGAVCLLPRFYYGNELTSRGRKAKYADVCADLRRNAWVSTTGKCLSAHQLMEGLFSPAIAKR